MKLKICGLREPANIAGVLETVAPEFIGFIFYPQSKRCATGVLPPDFARNISSAEKVGVFVNEQAAVILKTVKQFGLDLVQLHGDEPPDFCKILKIRGLKVIKAFPIHAGFDFETLELWQPHTDYFLFDTAGNQRGGNGEPFDWTLLEKYRLPAPWFLAGGIGPDSPDKLKNLPRNDFIPDLNSRFESEPGIKNPSLLKKFKHDLFS